VASQSLACSFVEKVTGVWVEVQGLVQVLVRWLFGQVPEHLEALGSDWVSMDVPFFGEDLATLLGLGSK